MSIVFTCEQCHRRYEVADGLAGKRGRCKQCGHTFRIPLAQGPTADEIYELEAGSLPSERLAEDPVRSLKRGRNAARVSGLFGLSVLPFWGFNVYRGAIVALLAAALLVGGVTKFVVAMTGLVLCVGPFIGSGFAHRFGIAFRDGPVAGLLYMFFVPYRIHYRLTHRDLFQSLRAPSLTLRDFGLLLLGLCFLPVVILAAQDMDKLARNHPPAVDWARFAGQPAKAIAPAATVPKRPAMPPLFGFARKPTSTNTPAEPVPVEVAGIAASASGHVPAKPPAPETLSTSAAEAEPKHAPPASSGPELGRPARFGHAPRFPMMPLASKPPASPGIGPDETITITVKGAGNTEAVQRLNQAIIAIMKPLSNNWRVSYSTNGDKTIFQVGPVTDPRAIADKIDFAKVTRVEGRTIDVEAGP